MKKIETITPNEIAAILRIHAFIPYRCCTSLLNW